MPTLCTRGFVLKSFDLADADAVFTVFTAKQGKISILTPSIKKITSKKANSFDLGNLLMMHLRSSKTFYYPDEIKLLKAPAIHNNLDAIFAITMVVDLVNTIFPAGKCEFAAANFTILEQLNANINAHNAKQISLGAIIKILTLNGYLSEVNICSTCHKPLRTDQYIYYNHEQHLSCAQCATTHATKFPIGVAILIHFWQKISLKQVGISKIPPEQLAQTATLTKKLATNVLGRPLRGR